MRTEGWAVFNSDDAGVLAHWKFHHSVNTSIWANNATMHAHTLDQHKTHTPPPSLDVFPHTESSLARRPLRIWMRHCWKESEEHQHKTDDRSNTHRSNSLAHSKRKIKLCFANVHIIISKPREREKDPWEREKEAGRSLSPAHKHFNSIYTANHDSFFHWYLSRPNLNDNIIWHSIKYILRTSDIVIFAAIWERFNISCCLDILAERTKSKACKAHFQQGLQTTNYQAMTSVSKVRICQCFASSRSC